LRISGRFPGFGPLKLFYGALGCVSLIISCTTDAYQEHTKLSLTCLGNLLLLWNNVLAVISYPVTALKLLQRALGTKHSRRTKLVVALAWWHGGTLAWWLGQEGWRSALAALQRCKDGDATTIVEVVESGKGKCKWIWQWDGKWETGWEMGRWVVDPRRADPRKVEERKVKAQLPVLDARKNQ